MTEHKAVEPRNLYQYEIMDRTHIIIELIDSALLNNSGITPEQTELVESALDILGVLYQDAGVKSYEPNTTTIPAAEYEQLKEDAADAELYRYLKDNNLTIIKVETEKRGFRSTDTNAVREKWYEFEGWMLSNKSEIYSTMDEAINAAMKESK